MAVHYILHHIHESLYLTAVQHQPSPVSVVSVACQTTMFSDCSRWEKKCANHEFPFFKTVEQDEWKLSENLKQRSLKIMHQSLLCAASFSLTCFYHPFDSSEQNVVFPSGYFDYRKNQAWKRLLQSDKILVKLRGHLNHNLLSLGTWTFSSWNGILAAMRIIKVVKTDTKNNSLWFLMLTFSTIIKNITEKLPEMLVGLWTDISNGEENR